MFVLAEFLIGVGVAAIVISLIYTGYRMGRTVQKEEDAE